jgi:group I intron endonuclease
VAAGVYEIANTVNGRRYIGSSVNLEKRFGDHRRQLKDGHHHSRFLQRAWGKYGADAFVFRPLILCSPETLVFYEQRFIDGLRPDYNSAPNAGSQLGFKHSDATRAKLSASAKRTKNFTGHRHSQDTKRAISIAKIGRRYGPQSAERRAKIGDAHRGRPRSAEYRAKISASLIGRTTGRGQLAPDQVRKIRALRARGLGQIRIGRALNIKPTAVLAVIGNHAYGWVK